MAILFHDGFDSYSATQITRFWEAVSSTSHFTLSNTYSRNATGQGIWFQTSAQNRYITKSIGADLATVVIGFGFKWESAGPPNRMEIVGFVDSTTYQCVLSITGAGLLVVNLGNTTPKADSGGFTLNANTWYHIELKVTIDNTVGAVVLNVNGVERINSTGLDLQVSANAFTNAIRIGNLGGFANMNAFFDDFYMLDTTGPAPGNDFLGDVKSINLKPSGNGNYSDLTGSDGNSTDNYLLVDEEPADDDTSYVESSTNGDIDTYLFEDMPEASDTIFAVSTNIMAKKDDAGARNMRSKIRISTTDYNGSSVAPSNGSYSNFQEINELNPADSAAWEDADVDGAEFGVEILT